MTSRASRIPSGVSAPRPLNAALGQWQAAVVRLSSIDPITTELVRLRCANYHDCGT
jgi:hypothetical protein